MNTDSSSWACKDEKGNIQVLLWDFTNTLPGDSVNNQDYYIRDLPAKSKGKVEVTIKGIPEGDYLLEVYQVGYRVNDPYATYLDLKRPEQLTRQEVHAIQKLNDGSPISQKMITVSSHQVFSQVLNLRENDVFLLNMTALQ